MSKNKLGERTICTHTGAVDDPVFNGAVSPVYMSTSYNFLDQDPKRYPRYFNTPNQEFLGKKVAALEEAEAGMLFFIWHGCHFRCDAHLVKVRRSCGDTK